MDINSIIEMIEGHKYKNLYQEEKFHQYSEIYNEACDDIIAKILKMSQWQPIETAPKDGTHFLGYREGEESYSEAWWRPDVQSFGGKGWRYPDNSGPTHWIHLPPKPTGGVK